jgi:hypothetical protein
MKEDSLLVYGWEHEFSVFVFMVARVGQKVAHL